MQLSDRLATGFVPLMARICLCLALLPMGWHKVFSQVAFSAADTARLNNVGVGDDGLDWARIKSTGLGATDLSTASPAPHSAKPLTVRALYMVSLHCEANGVPYPAVAGWLVALSELVGAVLLALGLFARLAALAVAFVMGGAVWLTTVPALRDLGWWNLPPQEYMQAWAQIGLLALAITVLLAGAGWLTLDSALSGRAPSSGRSVTRPAKGSKASSEE